MPARIAVANAVRNPRRTAATTSALLIGVTLISLTCVGIASVRKTFDVTMDKEYPVDVTIKVYDEKLPATAAKQLQDIKGITQVVPVKTATVKTGGETLDITGVDQSTAGPGDPQPDAGQPTAARYRAARLATRCGGSSWRTARLSPSSPASRSSP